MSDNNINKETTCRACLENTNNMKSIFEVENIMNKNIKLCTVLNYCTSLDIYEGDGLPTKICVKCVRKVLTAFTFKQQFIRANTILRDTLPSLLFQINTNDIDDYENYKFEHVDVTYNLKKNNFDSEIKCTEKEIEDVHKERNIKFEVRPIIAEDFNENISSYSNSDYSLDDNVPDDDILDADDGLQNYSEQTFDSDDETIQKKKIELSEKLMKVHGNHNNDKSHLTDRALRTYCREYKKRNTNSKKRVKDINTTCSLCKKILSTPGALRVHMKSVHSDVAPYLCSSCGQGFKNRNSYKEHLLTHDPNVKFECKHCGHISKNDRLLKYHIMHTHEVQPKKSFLCGVCGKSLTQKQALKKHLMIHTGEKPYECDLCGKHFRYLSVLKLHKRYHTEERPYPCTECDKRFREKTHLRKHLMIHTGEKPHECELCGKRFNTKTYLNIHKKTHTGERNHYCSICGKGFLQKYGLTTHMYTQHNLEYQQMQLEQQQQIQANPQPRLPPQSLRHAHRNPKPKSKKDLIKQETANDIPPVNQPSLKNLQVESPKDYVRDRLPNETENHQQLQQHHQEITQREQIQLLSNDLHHNNLIDLNNQQHHNIL